MSCAIVRHYLSSTSGRIAVIRARVGLDASWMQEIHCHGCHTRPSWIPLGVTKNAVVLLHIYL